MARPCTRFALGKCSEGAACRFSHAEEDNEPAAYFYGQLPSEATRVVLGGGGERPKPSSSSTPSPSSWAVVAKLPTSDASSSSIATRQQQQPVMTNTHRPVPSSSNTACKFYLQGACRYGAQCAFSHNDPPPSTTTTGAIAAPTHQCGICLDPLPSPGKKIGLLPACDHVFCFACIQNWRHSDMSQVDRTKVNVQLCPLCRSRSYFILPLAVSSAAIPNNMEEKQRAVQEFKAQCKTVPCKHGARCAFGTSCLYYHPVSDVDPAKLGLEFVKTADGADRAIRTHAQATLGDYILQ